MFVKFEDSNFDANMLIEKVRFGLHPTFGMEYRDIHTSPNRSFEMKYIGWGTF